MSILLTLVIGYLLGSLNFSIIFTRIFAHTDVRNHGSGNAGFTNTIRTAGKKVGILVFVCDALKAIIAILVAIMIERIFPFDSLVEYCRYTASFGAVLGHKFPIYYGFKGGKGVATSVGIFLVCCPIAIATGLGVFALGLLLIRIVSLSSLLATVTVVVMSCVFTTDSANKLPQIIMCVIMGIIVFAKHSANIKRLAKGEEK